MDRWMEHSEMRSRIGLDIPAYFSQRPSDELVARLLWITLCDAHVYHPLENTWVVVDGDARTERVLEKLRHDLYTQHGRTINTLSLPENRGKLWAMREGVRAILAERPSVEYILIRDGDGDHVNSDIPRLVRGAEFLKQETGQSRMIVIGSRASRHRPMGWLRGELEAMLDQVTLDALAYYQAQRKIVLDMRHCGLGSVADLSSGYKVYGREIAQILFGDDPPKLCGLCADDYWHFGPETVTIVEAVLEGVTLAEIPRLTWDGQPATSFGEFKIVRLYGALLGWVFVRLGIGLQSAAKMIDNVYPLMTLRTTKEGQDLLTQVRTYALDHLKQHSRLSEEIPARGLTLPFL